MWLPTQGQLNFIGIIASLLASLVNRHSIREVRITLNGRMQQLLEATKSAASDAATLAERDRVSKLPESK